MTASLHTLSGELLDDLIARLEKATGPDPVIDLEIARAQGAVGLRHNRETGQNEPFTYWEYTKLIDDAMSLLPDGWFLHDLGECVMPIRFYGDRHDSTGLFQAGVQHRSGGRMIRANGRNMPLAICIAALKARKP